jgi:hypothetical protein
MFKNLLLVSAALFSMPAMASFYDICQFDAEVLEVSNVDILNGEVKMEDNKLAAIVKILTAKDLGGHTQCKGYVGNINILSLKDADIAKVQKGQTLTLRYETWNSLTPTGVSGSTAWEIVEVEELPQAPVKIESAKFDEATQEIVLEVGVAGGCEGVHEYELQVGSCLETYPVQCSSVLVHKTDDECEAFITETVRIPLSEAGLNDSYYNGAWITINGDFNSKANIKLPFNQ